MVLIAGDQSAEPLQPSEQTLHPPATLVAAQLSPVVGLASILAVGRNHLDVVIAPQLLVEPVRVVSLVADQPRREFVEEASGQRFFDQLALVGRFDAETWPHKA